MFFSEIQSFCHDFRREFLFFALKIIVATIRDIILFYHFLMLYQILFSPQVKRSLIISNKHGIYMWSHKSPKTWEVS